MFLDNSNLNREWTVGMLGLRVQGNKSTLLFDNDPCHSSFTGTIRQMQLIESRGKLWSVHEIGSAGDMVDHSVF